MALWEGVAILMAVSQVTGTRTKGSFGGGDGSITLAVIEGCGFHAVVHEVTSSQGYVTTVFRVVTGAPPGRPVLMQHGFISSSDTWFQLANDSLPCVLGRSGYDVWLPNARGNHYSQKHIKFPIESYAYWKFSFHEMAVYDITATIDHICSTTKKDHVSYIGHSMGGAINFALLSTALKYNEKVNVAVTLAPACFLNHATNVYVKGLANILPLIKDSLTYWTYGELPSIPGLSKTEKFNDTSVYDIVNALAHALKLDQIHRGSNYLVDSTSIMTAEHLAQAMRKGTFARYDFGKKENLDKYGQAKPPAYTLGKITTRQFVMYADGDDLVSETDALRLCSALPSEVRQCYKVPLKGFDHYDFVSSKDAKRLVYDVVLRELGAGDAGRGSGSDPSEVCYPPAERRGVAYPLGAFMSNLPTPWVRGWRARPAGEVTGPCGRGRP